MYRVAILPDREGATLFVRVPGQDDWLVRPFEDADPTFAASAAGGLVLCATDAGDVALLDPATRTCLRRATLGRAQPKLQGLINRDGRRVYLNTAESLVALDTATLEVTAATARLRRRDDGQFDFVPDSEDAADERLRPVQIEPKPGLVEHEDGTLIGTFVEDHPDDPASLEVIYGITVFDPIRKTAARHVVQADQKRQNNNLRWFSPNGDYALRFHYGGVPRHDGRSSWRMADLFQRLLGRGDKIELPDCKLDGIERIGIGLELWQMKPLRPAAKIVAQMLPVTRVFGVHGEEFMGLARVLDYGESTLGEPFPLVMDFRVQQAMRWWDFLFRRVLACAWEPDGRGFWLLLEPTELRRIDVEGRLSPVYLLSALAHTEHAVREAGRDRILEVSPDGRLHVFLHGEHVIDPTGLPAATGNAAPIEITADLIPGVPLGSPLHAAALKVATARFDLPDLSEASLITAIDAVINRMDALLAVRGGYVRSVFLSPDRALDERAFFATIRELHPNAVPALRRLIATYVAKADAFQPPRHFYYTDEEVAFGHAALALATLDPHCFTELTTWLRYRDAGHDPFTRDDIMTTYLRRHGWTGESGLRLGIAFAHSELNGTGLFHIWRKMGLRDAARGVAPAVFSDLVLAEAQTTARGSRLVEEVIQVLDDTAFDRELAGLLRQKL